MATEFFFDCYPWDIEDEGVDIALTQLAGKIGVDGINIAAAYPNIAAFRPRRSYEPHTLRLSAAVAFQPEASRYASTHIRPIAGSWIKSRNPLARIAESAERRGIKLRLTVECCANAPLAEKYPMAAGVDVFGEPMPDRLCPSNPDVRAYLTAMIEDLCANYAPEGIELRSASFGQGVIPGEKDAPLSEWARYCRSLCFCASCRRAAAEHGVAVDDAAAVAMGMVENYEDNVDDQDLRKLFRASDELAAYQESRTQTVSSLLASLKQAAGSARLIARIIGDPFRAQSVETLAGILDGCIGDPPGSVWVHKHAPPAPHDAETVFGAARTHVRIHASRRMFPDGPHLVAEVRRIIERKVASISFENYGLLPEPCLDWVRQAVRFAKREAGG